MSAIELMNEFVVKEGHCENQYFSIYRQRIESLRETITAVAMKRWKMEPIVLANVSPAFSCCIMGVLFKKMKLQPSVLSSIEKKNHVDVSIPKKRLIDVNDYLILEDSTQRVVLCGTKMDPNKFVTGVVMGVKGVMLANGSFEVEDYVYPNFYVIPKELNLLGSKFSAPSKNWILFLSGLNFSLVDNHSNSLQYLYHSLKFAQSNLHPLHNSLGNIGHVVICGGIFDGELFRNDAKIMVRRNMTNNTANTLNNVLKSADNFLYNLLCLGVEMSVMPGENDPVSYFLPQQPFHPCIFPKSSSTRNFHAATNPYEFSLNNNEILGTSGQPISSIQNYTDIDSAIDALELCLQSQIISPSSPDILGCYPYKNNDPFIMNHPPKVLFCGCQSEFSSKLINLTDVTGKVHETLLMSVPNFSSEAIAVLLNSETLECFPLELQAI